MLSTEIPKKNRASLSELPEIVLIQVELLAAARAPIEGIEDEHHRLTPIVGQPDCLPLGIWQREIGRLGTDREASVLCGPLHGRRRAVQLAYVPNCQAPSHVARTRARLTPHLMHHC